MNTVETKFKIGQEVFYVENDQVKKSQITGLTVRQTKSSLSTENNIQVKTVTFYTLKENLAKEYYENSLSESFEQLVKILEESLK